MMSSSQYSPNIQHNLRVSPVYESEEEFEDSDDYSPTCTTTANGEAYMVTDFYHQPIPLPGMTPQGSDSGPEYSAPYAKAHSPNSIRHVFAPANCAFKAAGKQKPRMGVMATRSQSEKNTKPSDLWNFHHQIPPSQQLSNEELDSPVYDSTQYIVTPTRRRNSENDKSPNSRNCNRRDTNSRQEYPEIRGRSGVEGDELGVVPPGVVLLQPDMFLDGTLDSQIMSEIEMTNLQVAMHHSLDTENSGDSSTVQDRLLSGNHVLNGNGPTGQHYQQHKHHSYDLGAHRSRPMTGSGVVFRRRRKPCWCVLLVIIAVALMGAGISLGVLFGVMKGNSDQSGALQQNKNGQNGSQTPLQVTDRVPVSDRNKKFGNDTPFKNVIESTSWPTRPTTSSPPPVDPPPNRGRGAGSKAGLGGGVSVRRFKAYWHPGDSRVMEVLLSNGTVLQAAGHKGNDGTFRGLYSLSLTDGEGKTTRVRFMGGRNLASVTLPDGTVVSLDWSANNADVECKVFQIPPPRGAPGGGPGGPPDAHATPTSHLATLQLGVHSYLLRQISRTLDEASATPDAWEDEEVLNAPHPKFCAPRLPVRVTKCGGQYPYDGAFVQGEVTLQTGRPLAMAALPWLRQDDDDDCYSDYRSASPNFFIPLPGHVDRAAARLIAARFWRTAARWWGRVCDVVDAVLEVDLERHKVCANMAASAQTQLSHSVLVTVVYDSCSALLSSLHLVCRTLNDLVTSAAATPNSNSGNSNSASGGLRNGSRQPQSQLMLQRVLANSTSLQEPPTSPQQEVLVKTYAFCPSTEPLTSFEKSITLQSSQESSAAEMVHVNCPGHPEVTYFYLGHAAAIDQLDMVKHRLKVCAVCALEKTFSVHVQRDHMCCNDTCTRESRCEESSSEGRVGLGLSESYTFREQNSVYCHEFLAAADTPTRALSHQCLGTCQSNLEVRFQVRDAQQDGIMKGDTGRVYLDQVLTCLEGYRSTCKSTFGH